MTPVQGFVFEDDKGNFLGGIMPDSMDLQSTQTPGPETDPSELKEILQRLVEFRLWLSQKESELEDLERNLMGPPEEIRAGVVEETPDQPGSLGRFHQILDECQHSMRAINAVVRNLMEKLYVHE